MPAASLELGRMELRGPCLWLGRPNPATMRAGTTFAVLRRRGAAPSSRRGRSDVGVGVGALLGQTPEPPEVRAFGDAGGLQPGCQGIRQSSVPPCRLMAGGRSRRCPVRLCCSADVVGCRDRVFRGCATWIAGGSARRSTPAEPTRRDRPLLDRRWERPILR
jgi:hypothetical protein